MCNWTGDLVTESCPSPKSKPTSFSGTLAWESPQSPVSVKILKAQSQFGERRWSGQLMIMLYWLLFSAKDGQMEWLRVMMVFSTSPIKQYVMIPPCKRIIIIFTKWLHTICRPDFVQGQNFIQWIRSNGPWMKAQE